ncbi:hypothetical protein [Sphingomonas mesophila]|uniref:hypothetical protein n=1 Tax=Sphingomonas mesophila TaxID=2303576 RepID=UPI000E5765C5|nr:hypothetical protein [Sphingomonas mesophila]
MSASVRFIGFALVAWVGVRAASLGMFPGSTALVVPAAAKPTAPPVQNRAMVSPPAPPEAFAQQPYAAYPYSPPYPYPPPAPYPPYAIGPRAPGPTVVLPASWGAPIVRLAASRPSAWELVVPTPAAAERFAELEPWPYPAAATFVPRAASPPTQPAAPPPSPKLDRLQLSSWALLRNGLGNSALAQGGTLGGSQVGARLTYKFTPAIAASLRFSSSAGGVRGAEAAAGVRWQPFRTVPVALNVERRQRLGRWGGRSDFAAFVEGGVYQRPVALGFNLDAYAQGGWVGIKHGDWFADGSAALTRPLWRNLSGGLGVWAGGQSSGADTLFRVDAGPRLTYAVRRNVRLHLDYRQRIAGDALPRSGPALTVAGDF